MVAICSSIVIVLVFMFFMFPLTRTKISRYTSWCQTMLDECNFNAPEIIIRPGNKSVSKYIDGVNHIYIKEQSTDLANKKILTYMMAYNTTDQFETDYQYISNTDVLMSKFEKDELVDRRHVIIK